MELSSNRRILSMKKWDIYLIQHSHIDVGYTHRQEVITRYHQQFLRQAVTLANSPKQDTRRQEERFRFTCEGFWAVEQFLNNATEEERTGFMDGLRRGDLELSAFYLHLTELPNEDTLQASIQYAKEFCAQHSLPLTVAMASDINGLSWPVAEHLYNAGVRYLCTNINMHHGGYPLGGPLKPFWWETHKGNRLLVWNGLPYHRANLLGLIPGWHGNENAGIPGVVLDAQGDYINIEDCSVAEEKLTALLQGLEQQNYPLHILPLMGSGLYTDNSPLTDLHCDLIAEWNKKHGDHITLHSATLAEFFAALEKEAETFPVCRGDWNDWWSDGVASTPLETALFRNAQRNLRITKRLDPSHHTITKERLDEISRQLVLYSEHTWGHSHASETDLIVGQTFSRKSAYAIRADELSCTALDYIRAARGEGDFRVGQPLQFKIINPSEETTLAPAYLSLYAWEEPVLKKGIRITDNLGDCYPYQLVQSLRNTEVCVLVELKPWEERILTLTPEETTQETVTAPDNFFSNEYYNLYWNEELGVYSLKDCSTGQELLDGTTGLAAPLYQLFPNGDRWAIGGYNFQNRIPQKGELYAGTLQRIHITEHGPIRTRLTAEYACKGTLEYKVEYTLFQHLPQIYVTVKVQKQNECDPEGLYATFPFCPYGTWNIEKAGLYFQPGIEQIPGTCTDYYCVGDGAVSLSESSALSLTTLDAPLLHFNQPNLWRFTTDQVPNGKVFSWLTNNKWDTNFKRLCGGAYSFRYVVEFGAHLHPAPVAFRQCTKNSEEFLTIRL